MVGTDGRFPRELVGQAGQTQELLAAGQCIGRARPGQDLLVAGSIGQLGTQLLAGARESDLVGRFSWSYIKKRKDRREPEVTPYAEKLQSVGATGILYAGEGGILKAIWDASGAWQVGVTFSLRKIPVRQCTIEICEYCGCNPYRLWCGNCLVLAAENGGRVVEACEGWQIPAAVIGRVEAGSARRIRHGEVTGYLERPREDEIYRGLEKGRRSELCERGS